MVPLKDEEASIRVLASEVEQALAAREWDWECVWIDDGSTDGTLQVLRALREREPRHEYVSLDANYGQSAAMAIGFGLARGRIIATLDGDLQSDPADLPGMIDLLDRGKVDMVNGVRSRRYDSFVRRASSRIANGFRNWITRETVRDVGCSVRVCYRECVEDIVVWKGMHRFIPTLVEMRGFKAMEVPVNHRPRTHGKTKYGIHNRLWVGLWDCFAVRWMQARLVHGEVKETSLP